MSTNTNRSPPTASVSPVAARATNLLASICREQRSPRKSSGGEEAERAVARGLGKSCRSQISRSGTPKRRLACHCVTDLAVDAARGRRPRLGGRLRPDPSTGGLRPDPSTGGRLRRKAWRSTGKGPQAVEIPPRTRGLPASTAKAPEGPFPFLSPSTPAGSWNLLVGSHPDCLSSPLARFSRLQPHNPIQTPRRTPLPRPRLRLHLKEPRHTRQRSWHRPIPGKGGAGTSRNRVTGQEPQGQALCCSVAVLVEYKAGVLKPENGKLVPDNRKGLMRLSQVRVLVRGSDVCLA